MFSLVIRFSLDVLIHVKVMDDQLVQTGLPQLHLSRLLFLLKTRSILSLIDLAHGAQIAFVNKQNI
jgi:hypothetical protein